MILQNRERGRFRDSGQLKGSCRRILEYPRFPNPFFFLTRMPSMKATEAKLLDLLKKAPQFVIPIYQRPYSWTEKECRQLWDDVVRAGSNDAVAVHFMGSIVYEKGIGGDPITEFQPPLLVIDGQQRVTSVMLLIAALAKALGQTEPVDGFSPRKLRNWYLLNPEETDARISNCFCRRPTRRR
jgi:uncharacterized protein with ParB-like and HNH nuclease domain